MPEREKSEKVEPSLKEVSDYCAERMGRLLPAEFRTHLRAARKELLLAARSLIDERIERIEEMERRRAARKPTRVPVD